MKMMAVMAVMMGFAFSAMGQGLTDNATITGKAIVYSSMSVTREVDLNFGLVSPNVPKTVGLYNNVTGTPNNGTQTTGRFVVAASPNSSVDITFDTPEKLSDGTNDLAIGTYAYAWDTDNDANGGTPFSTGSLDGSTDVTMSGSTIYVFIGATLTPGETQVAGTYTGTITLTATYN